MTLIVKMKDFNMLLDLFQKSLFIQIPELGSYTNNLSPSDNKSKWITTLSNGYLIQPSDNFLNKLKACEVIFYKFHGNQKYSFDSNPNVKKRLSSLLTKMFPDISIKIIKKFVSLRTHARVKFVNKSFNVLKRRNRGRDTRKRTDYY